MRAAYFLMNSEQAKKLESIAHSMGEITTTTFLLLDGEDPLPANTVLALEEFIELSAAYQKAAMLKLYQAFKK